MPAAATRPATAPPNNCRLLTSCGIGFDATARRRAWPEALREELLSTIAALRSLSTEAPSGAATHVALAGAFRSVARIITEADERYAAEADDEAARWVRDRALLRVAERVREQRRVAAWRALGGVS